ncbi:MAG: hypothetical protein WCY19_06605 [Candidatus Gastranaerophilaceae bacterium]
MTAKIICVYNNPKIFDKVVKNNEHLKNCEIFAYDNTVENISITKQYNRFIEENIKAAARGGRLEKDFWCLFIHQDFGMMEDINPILEKLSTNNIYGAVGSKFYDGFLFRKNGFNINYGRILQGNNDFNFHEYGVKVKRPKTVDSVDCCCIIVHSSLVKKYNLHFDENLDFHMYAEEFCYSAKKNYRIKSKIVQMKCFHMGTGNLNEEFQKSAQYLKEKFNIKRVPSTCPT